ncbi:transglycosylase family protein [Mycolicibacillus trivialis]|uniref:Resuscitation-promoting factor n=1 Tax=Mycolicibacillus trivialis TaxID=1798 RepID=A0A1X2EFY5_9MYCO|nr:transglycosylase family protein [Mycolicibacillus trivialis]ORX00571.1 resuscitation-promoting factor [Mycolicibacillus trivialis]
MNLARSAARAGTVVAVAAAGLALSSGVAAADAVNWDAVAQCESGGNWSADTGNGYYGGLQISQSTWRSHGGAGSPATASRAQQIAVANRIMASQGPDAWPTCAGARAGTPRATWGAPRGSYLVNSVNEIIGLFVPGR